MVCVCVITCRFLVRTKRAQSLRASEASHCITIDYLFDFMTIFLISASFSIIFASFLTIHTFLEPYHHKNKNG